MDEPNTPARDESDVRHYLDMLDNALYSDGPLDGVSGETLDLVDAWANNIQLDIMRTRRRHEGTKERAARKEEITDGR
jgi:hypothetical protein